MYRPCVKYLFKLAVVIAMCLGCVAHADPENLRLGNPSDAKSDGVDKNNFLIEEEDLTLSYNNKKMTPNWVSWRLTKDDLGDAPRKPFKPDPKLPAGFNKVVTNDYKNAGFDRGHMCPHSDRAKDDTTSVAVFRMTNIVPQTAEQNQHAWDQLEIYCREQVKDGKTKAYIVAGPAGIGGTGKNGFTTKLVSGITVPSHCWKIIILFDTATNKPFRAIAVVMPNDRTVGEDWAMYRTSISDIEHLTGYTFLTKLALDDVSDWKDTIDDETIPKPSLVPHGN